MRHDDLPLGLGRHCHLLQEGLVLALMIEQLRRALLAPFPRCQFFAVEKVRHRLPLIVHFHGVLPGDNFFQGSGKLSSCLGPGLATACLLAVKRLHVHQSIKVLRLLGRKLRNLHGLRLELVHQLVQVNFAVVCQLILVHVVWRLRIVRLSAKLFRLMGVFLLDLAC